MHRPAKHSLQNIKSNNNNNNKDQTIKQQQRPNNKTTTSKIKQQQQQQQQISNNNKDQTRTTTTRIKQQQQQQKQQIQVLTHSKIVNIISKKDNHHGYHVEKQMDWKNTKSLRLCWCKGRTLIWEAHRSRDTRTRDWSQSVKSRWILRNESYKDRERSNLFKDSRDEWRD